MNDLPRDTDDPSSSSQMAAPESRDTKPSSANGQSNGNGNGKGSVLQWLKFRGKSKSDTSLRETIEEFIDAAQNHDSELASVSAHESTLISNVLKMRDHTVTDVMIPRADIFAIDITTSQQELLSILSNKQHSRIPVYRDTLDDVIGTIHIKDILGALAQNRSFEIENIIREVPIVSPAMQVLDLLLMMKQMRKHMALVVDEFGGIDGLVTINDVIESIVGEIEDEYDHDDEPMLKENADGSVLVDARYDLEEFEERFGEVFEEDERENNDTLGGLVSEIAGRVPARGEILSHPSGMVFEIVDADPRRINRLLVKNIPLPEAQQSL